VGEQAAGMIAVLATFEVTEVRPLIDFGQGEGNLEGDRAGGTRGGGPGYYRTGFRLRLCTALLAAIKVGSSQFPLPSRDSEES